MNKIYLVKSCSCLIPLWDSSSVVKRTEPAAPTAANSMGTITPFFRPNLQIKVIQTAFYFIALHYYEYDIIKSSKRFLIVVELHAEEF